MRDWTDNPDDLLCEGQLVAGRYELTGFVGRGGLAVVYTAVDTTTGQTLALRTLRPGMASEDTRRRFRRGAAAALMVQHPNVVRSYEEGLSPGPHEYHFITPIRGEPDRREIKPVRDLPFVTMELLRGMDLGKHIKLKGALGVEEALRLFIPCLTGLARAHAKGLIHKDLKPSNLFLAEDPEVGLRLKILDFDMVSFVELDTERLTRTRAVVGSLQYIAPEYFKDVNKTLTLAPTLDIYAMGLTLAEALMGKPAVTVGTRAATERAHVRGKLKIDARWREPTGPLGDALNKALVTSPADRWQDAEAFRDALKARLAVLGGSVAGLEVSGRPTSRNRDPISRFESLGRMFASSPNEDYLFDLEEQATGLVAEGTLKDAWSRLVRHFESAIEACGDDERLVYLLLGRLAQISDKHLGDTARSIGYHRQRVRIMLAKLKEEGGEREHPLELQQSLRVLDERLSTRGQWDELVSLIEEVIALGAHSTRADWLERLARIHHEHLGDTQSALRLMREVLENHPGNARLEGFYNDLLRGSGDWSELAVFCLKKGRREEASEIIEDQLLPTVMAGEPQRRLLELSWRLRHPDLFKDIDAEWAVEALTRRDLTPPVDARVAQLEKTLKQVREERDQSVVKVSFLEADLAYLHQVSQKLEDENTGLKKEAKKPAESKVGGLDGASERIKELEEALEQELRRASKTEAQFKRKGLEQEKKLASISKELREAKSFIDDLEMVIELTTENAKVVRKEVKEQRDKAEGYLSLANTRAEELAKASRRLPAMPALVGGLVLALLSGMGGFFVGSGIGEDEVSRSGKAIPVDVSNLASKQKSEPRKEKAKSRKPTSKKVISAKKDRGGPVPKLLETEYGSFLRIEPGTFTMGSSSGDSDETLHEVKITRAFLMQKTEVTQGQWKALMGNNPSGFSSCGDDCPVETVNWWEALAYANALSKKMKLEQCYELKGCGESKAGKDMKCKSVEFKGLSCKGWRLPTEAEWEYAAKTGGKGQRAGTLGEVAWYGGNSDSKTHKVGQKKANGHGLHDMLGNVWEWCWDRYGEYDTSTSPSVDPTGPNTGLIRVFRGGSWGVSAGYVRAAFRNNWPPGDRRDYLGFRLARSVP